MIDPNELKFGAKIFKIIRKHNMYVEKSYMTDENGVEWYRYDKDRIEYSIKTLTYCGKRFYVEDGECLKNLDADEVEYHFKDNDGGIEYYTYEFEHVCDKDKFFYTHFEAEQMIENLKK